MALRPRVPEVCVLCLSSPDLRESHVLPKFVIEAMKKRSATGYLRGGDAPNRRKQDFIKTRLLCGDCEQSVGVHENRFAQEFFYPFLDNPDQFFAYDRWMSRFAASVVWRVTEFVALADPLAHFDDRLLAHLEAARRTWREFLLGTRENVGTFELHVVRLEPPERLTPWMEKEVTPNLSRYFATTLDMNLVASESRAFAYAKLGRIAFFGHVSMVASEWQGTRLKMKKGSLFPRKQVIPRDAGLWMFRQAKREWDLFNAISETQDAVISAARQKNAVRVLESDAHKAMQNDLRLFGDRAFSDFSEGDGPDENG